MATGPSDRPKAALCRPGIVVLVGTLLAPFIEGALLFGSAGRADLPRGWLFLALALIGMFGGIVLVALANPELVNLRGRWKRRKDIRRWDKRLLMAYGVFGFYVLPVVIGLDVGRYRWSNLGIWAAVTGALLFCLGSALLTWSMLVNTHFETTVRIQRERAHRVITAGPYALIRHPGYLAISLWAVGTPLLVGSAYGLIPAGLAIAAIVARTTLEDRMLRAELPGYDEYSRRVRRRLLPGLW